MAAFAAGLSAGGSDATCCSGLRSGFADADETFFGGNLFGSSFRGSHSVGSFSFFRRQLLCSSLLCSYFIRCDLLRSGSRLLGGRDFLLLMLPGLFGGDPCLLCRFGLGGSLCLLSLLCPLGREPDLFFFGESCLFGSCDAGLFRSNLV
jgi:hypothetical protein